MSGASTSSHRPPPQGLEVLRTLSEQYGPRREGDLPWESGDGYVIAQLGRTAVVMLVCLVTIYLLSPVSFTGTGAALRVGTSWEGTALFGGVVAVSALVLALAALVVQRSQQWLPRAMVLQTDVAAGELAELMEGRLRKIGASEGGTPLGGRGVLHGTAFPVRKDYPPVRVVGSSLGYVTWGGARSLVVVPLSLFRHPRLGQDLDHVMREVLGWEKPEKVTTPSTTHVDYDADPE